MVTLNSLERGLREEKIILSMGTDKKVCILIKQYQEKKNPIIVPLPKEDDLQEPRPEWLTTARA